MGGSGIRASTPRKDRACLLSSVVAFDVVAKACKPASHEVQVRATVGARGLGLILAEEQEESRWVVKGFRPMPGGKPNPGQVLLRSTVLFHLAVCTNGLLFGALRPVFFQYHF